MSRHRADFGLTVDPGKKPETVGCIHILYYIIYLTYSTCTAADKVK